MKATTLIHRAVASERRAYVDYARIVDNMPVSIKLPVVWWRPGIGWYIDNHLEKGNSKQIIARYNDQQRALVHAIREHRAGKVLPRFRPLPRQGRE